MSKETNTSILDSRYQIHDEIGQGGMGVVYEASDRLTGQPVALKQMQFDSLASEDEDSRIRRLQLAQEFQVLAGLRHPNVISVYDYGFDEERQPYYTMSLLENPRTIIEVAKSLDDVDKAMLLVDMLQAIAYLHHRGIIHRDLKPENVLVDEGGIVHVLDFGLAADGHISSPELVGTLAYIAPEMFDGQRMTEAVDLYAVGVLAFEMFTGTHPYDISSYHRLIHQVLYEEPNIEALDPYPDVKPIIIQLISKDPKERHKTADSVIEEICRAVNRPLPKESADIREGYLQSAKFVGREPEVSLLMDALEATSEGRGSVILIGGESGIGKSRLLDEFRTRALVHGALVLRGQAVEGGGLPNQIWRDILRRLVLVVDLTEQEASVFKETIPEIDTLLNKHIPYPPSMTREDNRRRFSTTLIDVLRRVPRRVVLVLEDLQWALDSLAPVQSFLAMMPDAPFMVLGSYRSDEAPVLPELLPGVQHVLLDRLDTQAIASLTSAMLGESGTKDQVLDLVQRETEGNTYFIVEVVRALAENAGRLSDIGQVTLPQNVIAGGIQEIIRQRIDRVPQRYRGLLRLAAVCGRVIDDTILEHLAEKYSINIEDWQMSCSNAAVIEIHDERWRFTHDKLRHYLLDSISPVERPVFHQQVAEAIEWIHMGDMNYAAQLQYHWQLAQNAQKERYYAATAAGQMLATGDYTRARQLFERVLDLTPSDEPAQRGVALLTLADVTIRLSEFQAAQFYAAQALQTAKQAARVEQEIQALLVQVSIAVFRLDFEQALTLSSQAYDLIDKVKRDHLRVQILNLYGRSLAELGQVDKAMVYVEQANQLAQELSEAPITAECHSVQGIIALAMGDNDTAQTHWYSSLMLFESVGNFAKASEVRNYLGQLSLQQERYAVAAAHLELSLRMERDLGNRYAISDRLIQLGYVYMNLGNQNVALDQFKKGLQQAIDIDFVPLVVRALLGMAELQLKGGQPYFAGEFLGLAQANVVKNTRLQGLLEEANKRIAEVLAPDTLQKAIQTGQQLDMMALVVSATQE